MEPRRNRQHLPDALTHKRRERQFKPEDGKHIARDAIISKIHADIRGYNPKLYAKAMRTLPRIERVWNFRHCSPEDRLTSQAIYINRVACDYADHGIKGLKTTKAIEDPSVLRALHVSPNDPHKDQRIWDYYFSGFIECFSKDQRIPNRQEVHDRMVEIDRFSGLPEKLYQARERHHKEISKIVNRVIGQNQDPEVNLKAEVNRILGRPHVDYKGDKLHTLSARALDVCLAVSVYADIMEKTKKMSWSTAYTEGMMTVWTGMKDKPEMVRAIAEIE